MCICIVFIKPIYLCFFFQYRCIYINIDGFVCNLPMCKNTAKRREYKRNGTATISWFSRIRKRFESGFRLFTETPQNYLNNVLSHIMGEIKAKTKTILRNNNKRREHWVIIYEFTNYKENWRISSHKRVFKIHVPQDNLLKKLIASTFTFERC